MLEFEKKLFDNGVRYIAGVDEVGRGPLAGPMVVSAVILNLEYIFTIATKRKNSQTFTDKKIFNLINNDVEYKKTYGKINDSKKLTEKNRNELEKFIKENCLAYSIFEISHFELDQIGIGPATQKAFFNSVKNLKIEPEFVLTDAFKIKEYPIEKQDNIIEGDSKSLSIAAASIVAKVYRDNIMLEYSKAYPEYGFEEHKGYGTKKHLEAIGKFGPCEIHRRSFDPIRKYF